MCCNETRNLDLPAQVIETLAHYQRLLDERGWDWGDERIELIRWARFGMLGDLFAAYGKTGDWAGAVREVIGDEPPSGIVVVRVTSDGAMHVLTGPARAAVPGRRVAIDVVVDSEMDAALVVDVAGHDVDVRPAGTAVETIDVDGAEPAFTVSLSGRTVSVDGAVRTAVA